MLVHRPEMLGGRLQTQHPESLRLVEVAAGGTGMKTGVSLG